MKLERDMIIRAGLSVQQEVLGRKADLVDDGLSRHSVPQVCLQDTRALRNLNISRS